MRCPHLLIVGTTGMLAGASVNLAPRCDRLSIVARTEASIERLASRVVGARYIHELPLDWLKPDEFLGALSAHVREVGSPDVVVAWFHDDRLGPLLVSAVSAGGRACSVFQIRGSAAARPAVMPRSFPGGYAPPTNISYQQIVLGFHIEEGIGRWLDDAEICAGVLRAVDNPTPISVVGVAEPWSLAP